MNPSGGVSDDSPNDVGSIAWTVVNNFTPLRFPAFKGDISLATDRIRYCPCIVLTHVLPCWGLMGRAFFPLILLHWFFGSLWTQGGPFF